MTNAIQDEMGTQDKRKVVLLFPALSLTAIKAIVVVQQERRRRLNLTTDS
jgi:hypothetical protein